MDNFDHKYGIENDEDVSTYHRSRRMFCFYQGQLRIAEPDLPYSHAAWFEKEGWMTKENDSLMDEIVRGIIDSNGNVNFYIGYDFRVNDEIEKFFFPRLKELIEKMGLSLDAKVYGGSIKSEPGTIWPPVKDYGRVGDNLK